MCYVAMFIFAICIVSCGSEDEPEINQEQVQINDISSVLNGTFRASKKISYLEDGYESREIKFIPYTTPIKEEWSSKNFEGNWISEEITVYGECTITTSYTISDNINNSPLAKSWKYSITLAYVNAVPNLVFYPVDGYGLTETHKLNILSNSSFEMEDFVYQKYL